VNGSLAIAVCMWIGLVALTTVYWGHGVARAVIVVVVASLGMLASRQSVGRLARWDKRPVRRAAVVLVVALIGLHVGRGVGSVRRAARSGQIDHDQAQNVHQSTRLLRLGINPYGRHLLLDPVEYRWILAKAEATGCFAPDPEREARFQAWWAHLDPEEMKAALPSRTGQNGCEPLYRQMDRLGAKYGPVLIGAYWPFSLAFGPLGPAIVQLFLLPLLLGSVVLLADCHAEASDRFWSRMVAIVPLLVTPHVFLEMMVRANSDGLPVALGLLAWFAALRNRPKMAGLLLGLSVGAKTLPGLLLVPVVLRFSGRAWLVFSMATIAIYLPFLVWDPRGFFDNLVLFNLLRDTDDTSLAHAFTPGFRTALGVLGGLALCGLSAAVLLRKLSDWTYLWVAVAVVFVTAKIFHNNYLLWWLPLVGFAFIPRGSRVVAVS
jgi:hypothetical protein